MNSTHYEDFCSRMKNYRKRLGYNQTEMGKKLGISQDDYSKRENGHIIVSFNNMGRRPAHGDWRIGPPGRGSPDELTLRS